MINETMKKIQARIRAADSISGKNKTELLGLLSDLEAEINQLSRAKPEHAESITGFIDRSTHEAVRKQRNQNLLDLSLAGLAESVKEFEASHPALSQKISYICTALANMGI
jgi:hypothetical protein